MNIVGFVGGFGRSGSTLLERVVAELPGVCALGEVLHLWERGVRRNELCACGQPFYSCPFWCKVGDEAFGGWQHVDVDAVERLHHDVDRTRFIPADVMSGRLTRRHEMTRRYADYFARVYSAAATVSGADVVVDSSKNPSTAYALRTHESIDLRVLHVVRDSRGVAYSWTKQIERPEVGHAGKQPQMHQYSPAVSALLWDTHNLAFELLSRLGVPVRRVCYERFLGDPTGGLDQIASFLGVSSAGSASFLDRDAVMLGRTHQVAGNPMRFRTGEVRLRRDEAWREEFGVGSRALVTILTAPLMAGYRYPLSMRRNER